MPKCGKEALYSTTNILKYIIFQCDSTMNDSMLTCMRVKGMRNRGNLSTNGKSILYGGY